MDSRSLYSLILKVLGIFFIRNILEAVSRLLSVLVYLPQYDAENEGYFNLGVTIPPIVLYSIFSWLLIFRTDSVITMFRLDQSPRVADLPAWSRKTVLTTALIVIAGWMIVSELPEFFRLAVYYLQERKLYVRMVRPDISYLAMSAFRILIALLLIVFNKIIVNWLDKRTR